MKGLAKVAFFLFLGAGVIWADDVWYSQAYLCYLSLGYICMLSTNGMYTSENAMARVKEVRSIAQSTLRQLYQGGSGAREQALRVVYENLVFQANGLLSVLETPSEEVVKSYDQLRQKTWYALEMVKEIH